jgi:hypothetical protein
MKTSLPPKIEQHRIQLPGYEVAPAGSIEGAFMIPYRGRVLKIISGCGDGWDHVSVSLTTRCPSWREMCFVKDLFFAPDECVIQFHPPESEYVNHHPYVLHLWRPWNFTINLPPKWMIA